MTLVGKQSQSRQFSNANLPLFVEMTEANCDLLMPMVQDLPHEWPLADRVLVWLLPTLLENARAFHLRGGPGLQEIVPEHALEKIDRDATSLLWEQLVKLSPNVSAGELGAGSFPLTRQELVKLSPNVSTGANSGSQQSAGPLEPGRLFRGISVDRSGALELASDRLAKALFAYGGDRKRSLAEVWPTEADYEWLAGWFRRLDRATFRRLTDTRTDTWRFGTLLLLYFSETTRRYSIEGELWREIKERLSPAARNVLFPMDGLATEAKSAITRAVALLKLRNALDWPESQRWLNTVYLQFGFTRRGLVSSIPHWLSGYRTTRSLEALLDGADESSSFRDFWNLLVAFRRGRETEAELRANLKDVPWILDDWRESVVAASRASPWDREHRELFTFSGRPTLRWTTKLQFDCALSGKVPAGLSGDAYDLMIDGRRVDQLTRQADGRYALQMHRDGSVAVAPSGPHLVVELASHGRGVVESYVVELWDEEEDVNIFSATTGKRFDDIYGDPLPLGRDYHAIVRDDLRITPDPAESVTVCAGWRAIRIAAADFETTRFELDGTEWTPLVGAAIPDLDLWQLSDGRVQVNVGPSVSIESVRQAGSALARTASGCFGPLSPIPRPGAATALIVRVRSNGRVLALRRTVRGSGAGTLLERSDSTSRLLTGDSEMLAADFRGAKLRVSLSAGTGRADCFFFDGFRCLGKLGSKPRALVELSALGERLYVGQGRFNCEELLLIATSVVDGGLVRAVEFSPEGAQITLVSGVQPDQDHQVVVWSDTSLEFVPAARLQVSSDGCLWTVPLAVNERSVIGIGIAYNGSRVGAWWERDWRTRVTQKLREAPTRSAAIAAWLHMPLAQLDPIALHPVPIRAWLFPEKVHQLVNEGAARLASVLHLSYIGRQRSEPDVDELLDAVASAVGHVPPGLAEHVALIDPWLAGAAARRFVNNPSSASSTLGLQIESYFRDGRTLEELEGQCASQLSIDRNFLSSLLKFSPSACSTVRDLENLVRACSEPTFRQLAMLRAFDRGYA